MKNKKVESFVTCSVFVKETTAIRADMNSMGERLGLAIARNSSDILEIKETMATKNDINKVLSHIDAFTHGIETYDRKAVVHDARLNDHEAHITRLERPA